MTQDAHQPGGRTRSHPDERFAAAAQEFDLDAAAGELAREASSGSQGHRQKTLYRHGNSTLALFLFPAGTGLREHRTSSTVFIQVLAGRMTVQAQGQQHDLSAGQMLVMAPDVPHDLHAENDSRMLLTVCLEPRAPRQS